LIPDLYSPLRQFCRSGFAIQEARLSEQLSEKQIRRSCRLQKADRDFKLVDDYLYMQKPRFEDRLNIISYYQDRSFFIPAFSLQTLRCQRKKLSGVWLRLRSPYLD
jgi:hypothetical protein